MRLSKKAFFLEVQVLPHTAGHHVLSGGCVVSTIRAKSIGTPSSRSANMPATCTCAYEHGQPVDVRDGRDGTPQQGLLGKMEYQYGGFPSFLSPAHDVRTLQSAIAC